MEVLANFLVGFVLVPIIQVIKKYTGLKDRPMFWTATAICVIGGFLTSLITGEITPAMFNSPEALFTNGAKAAAVVFAAAQILYNQIKRYLS